MTTINIPKPNYTTSLSLFQIIGLGTAAWLIKYIKFLFFLLQDGIKLFSVSTFFNQTIFPLLLFFVLLAAVWSLGLGFNRIFKLYKSSGPEKLVVSIGFGWGILSMLIFIMGITGLLFREMLYLIIIVSVYAFRKELQGIVNYTVRETFKRKNMSIFTIVAGVLITMVLMDTFIGAINPHNQGLINYNDYPDEETLALEFKKQGITHILINRDILLFQEKENPYVDKAVNLVEGLIQKKGTMKYRDKGVYLYEIIL